MIEEKCPHCGSKDLFEFPFLTSDPRIMVHCQCGKVGITNKRRKWLSDMIYQDTDKPYWVEDKC